MVAAGNAQNLALHHAAARLSRFPIRDSVRATIGKLIVRHYMETLNGSCLCGSVAFKVTGEPFIFLYCHCRSCQKSSGSIHVANLGFPLDSVSWTRGEDLIGRFVDAKDNPGFTRCFCRNCGAVLPKLSRNQKFWVVPSGLLDSDPKMRPKGNIFWAERAPWYVPVEQIPTFEGPYVEKGAALSGAPATQPGNPGVT